MYRIEYLVYLLAMLWRLSPQLRGGKRYRPELIFRFHTNKKVDIKTRKLTTNFGWKLKLK